jgi:tRNA-specific 2-thiouridylase
MINEYKNGRTPNPDIMCNKHIKFDAFLKKALDMGADKIATGHYVRLENLRLKTAKDNDKDQSYFLWTLTQNQLKHCIFPIGGYKKDEVRKMAKKFKLSVFNKKDSQGLCFVGEFKIEDFLKNYITPQAGKIVDADGNIIGRHNGVQYYTIGQRHGVGATGSKPVYIVKKNLERNILIVTDKKREEAFYKKEISVKNTNWIAGSFPDPLKKYHARVRYRQPLQKCIIKEVKNKEIKAVFGKPQRAAAPGQSFVLYNKDELVGGGIIQ